MKEYNKPIIEEEKIELEDIIAASAKVYDYDDDPENNIWNLFA